MRYFLIFIFTLFYQFSCAQVDYEFGIMPVINLNKKIKNDWQINFSLESRQLFKQGEIGDGNKFNYEYGLTDFTTIISKKVGINSKVNAGYLIRLREGEWMHRSIQQFSIVQKFTRFRLSHRLASDQSFMKNSSTEVRFRYRLGAQIPLNGESSDPKEFYLKINHEYLNAIEAKTYDLEIRIVPMLGYIFTDNNKLELGLDYRMDSFTNANLRSRFWIKLNWYFSL